jgi:hypothetical protein
MNNDPDANGMWQIALTPSNNLRIIGPDGNILIDQYAGIIGLAVVLEMASKAVRSHSVRLLRIQNQKQR